MRVPSYKIAGIRSEYLHTHKENFLEKADTYSDLTHFCDENTKSTVPGCASLKMTHTDKKVCVYSKQLFGSQAENNLFCRRILQLGKNHSATSVVQMQA